MPDWAIPENIHTPLWTTLNWILKNFRISKNDSSRFCRIPNLADSKYWGIPDFAKLIMILVEFRSKFTKFWGNSWISSQAYQAFSTGFPMSSIGGAWIFSWIAHYKNKRTKKVQTRAHKGTAEKRTEYEILKSQSQKTHTQTNQPERSRHNKYMQRTQCTKPPKGESPARYPDLFSWIPSPG